MVPRDDAGKWLVREPTADIFDKTSVVKSEVAGADTFARQPFQVNHHSIIATIIPDQSRGIPRDPANDCGIESRGI